MSMAFKFNFNIQDDEGAKNDAEAESQQPPEIVKEVLDVPMRPAEEVFIQSTDFQIGSKGSIGQIDLTSGLVLKHNIIDEHTLNTAIPGLDNSDLAPNIYEGGLKIWECSIDLVNFLATEEFSFKGLRVLELGCGAGLPGIFFCIKGSRVDFQDYNHEVINRLTIPNVILNSDGISTERYHFYAGDWASIQSLFRTQGLYARYDVILTSETIYNVDNQRVLYNLMKECVRPTGRIYVAAKSHYFGLGGSIEQFVDLVLSDGHFKLGRHLIHAEGY